MRTAVGPHSSVNRDQTAFHDSLLPFESEPLKKRKKEKKKKETQLLGVWKAWVWLQGRRTCIGLATRRHSSDAPMIMISLSVMRSGVHVRPTRFFEEELGFGRKEKRIVGIRRVPGLGRGIRVLNKPHLYSHRQRERERKDRLVLLSSC